MAAIHTPSPLATALGLISAIILGEMAVSVGLFTKEVIFYVAIATIGQFATPSYELSMANRFVRVFLLSSVFLLGKIGFLLGIFLSGR